MASYNKTQKKRKLLKSQDKRIKTHKKKIKQSLLTPVR